MHFIKQYKKQTFINITTDIVRKAFKYWKTVKFVVADMFFKISNFNNFCLKA